MADRPMLFSIPMVQAMLAGIKTQTRRVIKPQPPTNVIEFVKVGTRADDGVPVFEMKDRAGNHVAIPSGPHTVDYNYSPRCAVGDRLYVREPWRTHRDHDKVRPRDLQASQEAFIVAYEADADGYDWLGRRRHSMHLPRALTRLTLIVTDIAIERLQDITEEDATAEGVDYRVTGESNNVAAYSGLWDRINRTGAWKRNPWVVVHRYTVERRNIDASEGR